MVLSATKRPMAARFLLSMQAQFVQDKLKTTEIQHFAPPEIFIRCIDIDCHLYFIFLTIRRRLLQATNSCHRYGYHFYRATKVLRSIVSICFSFAVANDDNKITNQFTALLCSSVLANLFSLEFSRFYFIFIIVLCFFFHF